MLVLTRRVGQSIVIDNETIIRIERVDGNNVKVSFDAPDEISILRKELWDKEQRMKGVLVRPNVSYYANGRLCQ